MNPQPILFSPQKKEERKKKRSKRRETEGPPKVEQPTRKQLMISTTIKQKTKRENRTKADAGESGISHQASEFF
jgi:hypothetical protein